MEEVVGIGTNLQRKSDVVRYWPLRKADMEGKDIDPWERLGNKRFFVGRVAYQEYPATVDRTQN